MRKGCLIALPTVQQLVEYEIHGSWWTSYISHPVLQNWAGKYYAAKVRRKYLRVSRSHAVREALGQVNLAEVLATIRERTK